MRRSLAKLNRARWMASVAALRSPVTSAARCVTQARRAPSPLVSATVPVRWVGSSSQNKAPLAAPAGSAPLGVVHLTTQNLSKEMDTKVPLFLYFMVTNHPDVCKYTEMLSHQVDQFNRRLQHDGFGELYQEFGPDSGLAIKLGMIDCLKEPGLTQKFNIDPHMFPIVYFCRSKVFHDKLSGIVTESQVKEATEAFIEFAKQESKSEKDGTSLMQRIKRTDNDDENPMTLIGMARTKMQGGEIPKARMLFEKALAQSEEEIKVVNERYNVGGKKMTRELWMKLKREPCYNTAPEAQCGLAMCALVESKMDEAVRIAAQVRQDYPFALQDMRSVAEAVARVELMHCSNYNPSKDNYVTLLRRDDEVLDETAFYELHLKRAVAFYVESSPSQSIEELLKLIRAEPKLAPALKASGKLPPDFKLGPKAQTPARKALLCIFEALGPTDEKVVKGRKVLQQYL